VTHELFAVLQVVFIDIVLAGDNAIVVAMAAAGAPAHLRRKAIFYGIAGAVVLRIALALSATQLLHIVGLLLAGGILLLWVCWKLYRELREGTAAATHAGTELLADDLDAEEAKAVPNKTFGQSMRQIIIADISMSLDNVLAVAGAARDHPYVLALGLLLSIVLMGAAATLIARLLERHRWLAWLGLAIILYVALSMIWHGAFEVEAAIVWAPCGALAEA
jgi:YjbE family integral membrane protein